MGKKIREIPAEVRGKEEMIEMLSNSSELQEKEEIIRSILDSSYDGIMVISGSGKVLYASQAVQRITGLIPSKLIGQNIFELWNKGTLHQDSVSIKVLKSKRRMKSEW